MTHEYAPIEYARMPYGSESGGSEWMNDLPAAYVHGQQGFDRRIMEELASVGVPCYTLDDLSNGPRTIPQGIPIFIDWLANLETKIPGPETEHRSAIRSGLIRNLIDPAARGNQQAIDLLIAQVQRRPPLPTRMQDWACLGLRTIATAKNFDQIAGLLAELPEGSSMIPLVEYLGKVKTPSARALAVQYLGGVARGSAIKALVQMKATGVRHLIEPLLNDPHPPVRKQAQRALEKLPA
ncbi:HEAT repeat domain-containing protein [Nocardia sp. NPDC050713]|uniref:HEAT repeat domain-containing protein n=1 Tax=Nocardia sp. NPDC050713 TaxID=3154511 RepID=UPI0033E8A4EE